VRTPDGWDFRGPYVQGRRGERFFYLTWGELPPGGSFAMFRRAKLYFADLDPPAGSLFEAHLGMTDVHGDAGLRLGATTPRPVANRWRIHPV
jgi:hypothetical protein